ncbi:hypothetical protein QE152_g4339 [Popillia japonica]|uniref:Uncharacterized protein n=1 Tax=Popillia japonica TaxID=7064 RepID=A0AAW1MVY0_POPJA
MQGENTGSDSEESVAINVDNKMEMLIKMINEIMTEVKELRKDKKIYITEIKEVKEENAKLREEVNKMKTKIEWLETIEDRLEKTDKAKIEWLETIEDRLEKTDKAKRKNNIIISGLKIETNDDSKMEEKINEFIKEERSKNRNCKVIMGYQKMIVDGKKWNWDNKTKKLKIEDQRPKNLNG